MASELVLSNSRANTFRRCQRQYGFKYVDKLRPKVIGLPLKLGDWMHQLLMVHADGFDWRERHGYLRTDFDKLLVEEQEELGDLPAHAERLIKGYLAHYRKDDERYHVVDTEISATVELPNGMLIILIIDKIVEDKQDGGLWIWDYKCVSQFYPEDFMLIDSQLALYFWGATKRLGYRDVRGAVLDELITRPPTLPKMGKTGRFERRKNLRCDAYTYYSVIKQSGQEMAYYADFIRFLRSRHNDWWRRTFMPRDAPMTKRIVQEMMWTGEDIQTIVARNNFVRSARKDCRYDCSFLDLCQAELQGIDTSFIIKSKYTKSKRPDQEDMEKLWPTRAKEAAHGKDQG